MLNEIEFESAESSSPPLVIAHGLFGSARNWGVIAKRLSESRKVIAVDMRNHGFSPREQINDYPAMAVDLAETIDRHGGIADFLGHSMGGKAAMVTALSTPDKIRKLIVADIAPVSYSHTQMPLLRAMQGLDLAGVTTRREADARLGETIPDPQVRAFLLQSLDVRQAAWRLNFDVLAANMDSILGFPDVSGSFSGPTLFLRGALSEYVLPEHRQRIKALFPSSRMVGIPGAGHWLHAEKPREFEVAVRTFLDA